MRTRTSHRSPDHLRAFRELRGFLRDRCGASQAGSRAGALFIERGGGAEAEGAEVGGGELVGAEAGRGGRRGEQD